MFLTAHLIHWSNLPQHWWGTYLPWSPTQFWHLCVGRFPTCFLEVRELLLPGSTKFLTLLWFSWLCPHTHVQLLTEWFLRYIVEWCICSRVREQYRNYLKTSTTWENYRISWEKWCEIAKIIAFSSTQVLLLSLSFLVVFFTRLLSEQC